MNINTVVHTIARFITKQSPNVQFLSLHVWSHMLSLGFSGSSTHISSHAVSVHSRHSVLWLPVMVAFQILSSAPP
jgi:hypothetical protein